MLDIKFIRENKDLVSQNNRNRKAEVDLDELFRRDDDRLKILSKVEELRAERKKRSKTKPSEEEIALIRKIGDEIDGLEKIMKEKEAAVEELLNKIPNLTHESVPVGKDEADNKVIRSWGEPKQFDFKPKEHWQIGEDLGIIDLKKAAEVSGARFAYLKGKLALLEFALVQYAMSVVTSEKALAEIIQKNNLSVPPKPFIPVIPPVLIKPEVLQKMARLEPRDERYHITGDDLYLVGSAEHTLGPLHMDEMLSEDELPLRYVGLSPSFRREAGSYGKDTKGIMRVHQFNKLEMESFTAPENSLAEQDFIVAVQEYFMQALELPYQVVAICTGDMAMPDYRQIDINTWLPGQNAYRETHTSDLNTDYQARRLNTKVKMNTGKAQIAHMNDATLFAFSRLPIAIIENYQQADGSVAIPKALRKYTGFDTIA